MDDPQVSEDVPRLKVSRTNRRDTKGVHAVISADTDADSGGDGDGHGGRHTVSIKKQVTTEAH